MLRLVAVARMRASQFSLIRDSFVASSEPAGYTPWITARRSGNGRRDGRAVEHLPGGIVERTQPLSVLLVPDHVAEVQPGYRCYDFLPVDVGAYHVHRRSHRQCITAGAGDELSRARSAEIDRLEK